MEWMRRQKTGESAHCKQYPGIICYVNVLRNVPRHLNGLALNVYKYPTTSTPRGHKPSRNSYTYEPRKILSAYPLIYTIIPRLRCTAPNRVLSTTLIRSEMACVCGTAIDNIYCQTFAR